MNKTYIFHHDDLDGIASSLILKNYYFNSKCISCSYEKELINPLNVVNKNDTVVIVDYSFAPEIMRELYLLLDDNLIWLDHHISAINNSKKHGYNKIRGVRDTNYCGTELSWSWCIPNRKFPNLIKAIGDFDTFRNFGTKSFKDALCIFYGIKSYDDFALFKAIESYYHNWDNNDSSWYSMFYHAGEFVYLYKLNEYKENGENNSYERTIWGLKVLCMNTYDGGLCLQLPKIYNPEKHDMIVTYNYNGNKWCYGFYTDKDYHPEVDCSKIASQYGGGGHKAAAGATTNYLLKELI